MNINRIIDRLDFRTLCEKFVIRDQYSLNKFISDISNQQKENDKLKSDLLEMCELILSDEVTEIEISMMEMKAEQTIKDLK